MTKSRLPLNHAKCRSAIHRMPSIHWLISDIRCWLAATLYPSVGLTASTYSEHHLFPFVVGAGRSGNTLFRRLLMENTVYIFLQRPMFCQKSLIIESGREVSLGTALLILLYPLFITIRGSRPLKLVRSVNLRRKHGHTRAKSRRFQICCTVSTSISLKKPGLNVSGLETRHRLIHSILDALAD